MSLYTITGEAGPGWIDGGCVMPDGGSPSPRP
jgi:hypothetical protein